MMSTTTNAGDYHSNNTTKCKHTSMPKSTQRIDFKKQIDLRTNLWKKNDLWNNDVRRRKEEYIPGLYNRYRQPIALKEWTTCKTGMRNAKHKYFNTQTFRSQNEQTHNSGTICNQTKLIGNHTTNKTEHTTTTQYR